MFQHVVKAYEASIKNPITVEIEAAATKGNIVVGLYGRLVANNYYRNAIEGGSDKKKPEYYSKSGDLVIWESNYAIGTGSESDLAESLFDAMKGEVKEFVTLYIKYNKQIE